MNEKVDRILEVQNSLGEGPLWDHRVLALYWVDIPEQKIFRYFPSTGSWDVYDVSLPVSVMGIMASGGFILGTSKGFATWNPDNGMMEFIADPEDDQPESRFNDGAVDRQGRFWAGTYSKKTSTTLYRLDADHTIHIMETGITVCNGIGWSPDNKTMYFTDTRRRLIYAYDFDVKTGSVDNRRPFVHTPEADDVPDGLTVDNEGFVWSARFGGWKVVRYDPGGKIEREIKLPVKYPTSCTFGGEGLSDLYITTCRSYVPEEHLKEQPLAGDLFLLRTDFRGIENPEFSG